MNEIILQAKFVNYVSEERTSKKDTTYQFEEVEVFVDEVGKLKFSFDSLSLGDSSDPGSLEKGDKVRLTCALDTGKYSSPLLKLTAIDLA